MITDLKDLKALFKLCRAQGVTDFKMNGIEVKLGELPEKMAAGGEVDEDAPIPHGTTVDSIDETEASTYAGFPQGVLTPEQLMFYSSGGNPSDDPENKAI